MIKFYPRDIGMWRGKFDFSNDIRLVARALPTGAMFQTKDEFFEFLKTNGVRLDDPNFPLMFEDCLDGTPRQTVTQWTTIGWVKWS